MSDALIRCDWCAGDPVYEAYHDDEWGVPIHDDQSLFALLMLEGFQAGLSWRTILSKRDAFVRAFDDWDPERIAAYDEAKIAALLADPGIIRNRLKVRGAVTNAQAYLRLVASDGGDGAFDRFLWAFVGGHTFRQDRPATVAAIPAKTAESDAMSKALKARGFTFVGSAICYAFMQSAGLVDDHVVGCWRAQPSG